MYFLITLIVYTNFLFISNIFSEIFDNKKSDLLFFIFFL